MTLAGLLLFDDDDWQAEANLLDRAPWNTHETVRETTHPTGTAHDHPLLFHT